MVVENTTNSWIVATHLSAGWFNKPRWEVVDLGYETSCWRWLASLNPTGYGQIGVKIDGRSYAAVAHRVLYERANNRPVPAGLELDHLCNQRRCVRPDHLEVVTRLENMRRAAARAEWRVRKLSPEQVRELRTSRETVKALAHRFGVDYKTAWCAKQGITYKDCEPFVKPSGPGGAGTPPRPGHRRSLR